LRYRDESLNWLLDAAPASRVRLGEGDGYRLSCDAFVEISTAGKTAAVGAIEPASTAFARCAAWIVNAAIPRWLRLPHPAR